MFPSIFKYLHSHVVIDMLYVCTDTMSHYYVACHVSYLCSYISDSHYISSYVGNIIHIYSSYPMFPSTIDDIVGHTTLIQIS